MIILEDTRGYIVTCSCRKRGLIYKKLFSDGYVCGIDCGLDIMYFQASVGWTCGVDGHTQIASRPVKEGDIKIEI